MKRRDLIKLLEKNGWRFDRNGGSHDVFIKGNGTETYRGKRKSRKSNN